MAKFLTKKVCLISLAVVIALGGVIWAIVANLTPKFRSGITELPTVSQVSGNGTASVMVDNYLYFVGDSVTTANIKYGDNEYYAHGKIPDSGIFRVKIGDNAKPVVTYEYNNTYQNDDGENATYAETDEKYNTVVSGITDWNKIGQDGNGIQAVVPQIAGHDKTAMWVFGQYLIYTTPHNRLDNRGNLMSSYLDFYRVDLDGNNHTWLYTTDSTNLTTKNFTVWSNGNEIYLLVSETDNENETPVTKIKKINVKTKAVVVLDTEVTNVVLPFATQYKTQSVNQTLDKVYGGVMGYVYYTKKARGENSTLNGNLLYRCGVAGGEAELVANGVADKGTTFTPLAVTPMNTGDAQFVFAIKVYNSNATFYNQDLRVITNDTMASYDYKNDMPLPTDGSAFESFSSIAIYANGFCTLDNKLYHYTVNGTRVELDSGDNHEAKQLLSSSTVDAVLAVMDNTIYVQSGNNINIYDYQRDISRTVSVTTSATKTENTDSSTDGANTTSTTTLPIAVLYQPQGNTGDPIMFAQDATSIRLYHTDKTFDYLRFKAE